MKKLCIVLILALGLIFPSACSKKNEAETAESNAVQTLDAVYADEITDGIYEIEVEASSSMFRVVKCMLEVKDKKMTAEMTMSGKGYGKVYMGTAEKALTEEEDMFIPFEINENGQKTFTVPVEKLNAPIECAAWSIKKEKWYDREIIFKSDLIPQDAYVSE